MRGLWYVRSMMTLSIRQAKARFAEAAAAAARGERVTITKYGKPFIEMVPAETPKPEDLWAKLDRIQKDLGLDGVTVDWPENFDDPAFSRQVLGLED